VGIEVTAVHSPRELAAFVRVPALLRRRSGWTPASEAWARELLDRRRNPYYRHADRQLLLARKDGRLVGRVAAHVDHLCNRASLAAAGTFGLLECEPHQRVVTALLETAERWLLSRGAEVVRGPSGPAMRLGCGLLVEGFAEPPMPGTGQNPPELPPLVERAGYAAGLDLHAYRIELSELPRPVAGRADDARRRRGVVVRPIRLDRKGDDLDHVLQVINDLPGPGCACAPWSQAELLWTVARLRPLLDDGLALLLEIDGQPAGLAVALRNVREPLGGRGPGKAVLDLGRVALAMRLRQVRTARIAVLGVRPRFAAGFDKGLHALLLTEIVGRLRLHGVAWAELSLVDPSDPQLGGLLSDVGAMRYKTFRIYEKRLLRAGAAADRGRSTTTAA